jgi:hypothetical protein
MFTFGLFPGLLLKRSSVAKVVSIWRNRRRALRFQLVFVEGIISRTERHIGVQQASAASSGAVDIYWLLFSGGGSWLWLALRCTGRCETELGSKAASGRTSGLNGQIPIDLIRRTATFGAAVLIQASANSFGN